jgi:glycine/D-amino acid oxidase-like deaminating enzyme
VTEEQRETVIIGAGIHGVSTALALASRGRRSLILEAAWAPFEGASVRNEGKVHLGFVYALDEDGTTTRAMVEGSLAFAPLVEKWCGPVDWQAIRSSPFAYVAMDKGLAGPDQLESHYESVLSEVREAAPDFGTNYLGVDPGETPIVRHDGVFPGMTGGHSGYWFETPERAVQPRSVAALLERAAIDEPGIEILTGHRVTGARRLEAGFELEVETSTGARKVEAGTVINCAWDGRPALDRMILDEPTTTNFRVKYSVTVRGEGDGSIGTATLAQGPFGDILPWPGGEVYINWYPTARTHFGDRPAEELEADPGVAEAVREVIGKLFPALQDFEVESFAPCYILAEGQTDISDPGSRLHSRKGAVFVERDGWWSIRSSKLTTAPLAGERCAASVTGTEPAF